MALYKYAYDYDYDVIFLPNFHLWGLMYPPHPRPGPHLARKCRPIPNFIVIGIYHYTKQNDSALT